MNNLKLLPSLLIFSDVASKRSFTLTAKKLGMSKSAISQQVKRLEQHIGHQLLSRHTRGMSLTAEGEKLLSRCELLRTQVEMVFEELSYSKTVPSGVFALTIPHSCEKDIIFPALNQLCSEYPKIQPKLIVSDEPKDLIQENLDVAIYGGNLQDSNYRALPIGTARDIFCASPGYIRKRGLLTKLEDIDNHRWIAAPWQTNPLLAHKNSDLSNSLSVKIDQFGKTNTSPSTIEMVLNDMGISLLPEFAVQAALSSGNLVRVLPEFQGTQWPFYMIHRFHGEKPVHISRFYQLVKHNFSKVVINYKC